MRPGKRQWLNSAPTSIPIARSVSLRFLFDSQKGGDGVYTGAKYFYEWRVEADRHRHPVFGTTETDATHLGMATMPSPSETTELASATTNTATTAIATDTSAPAPETENDGLPDWLKPGVSPAIHM